MAAGPRTDYVVEQLYNAYTAPESTTPRASVAGTVQLCPRRNLESGRGAEGGLFELWPERAPLAESASPRRIDGASARFAILETLPDRNGTVPPRPPSPFMAIAHRREQHGKEKRKRERQRTRMNRQDATFPSLVLYPETPDAASDRSETGWRLEVRGRSRIGWEKSPLTQRDKSDGRHEAGRGREGDVAKEQGGQAAIHATETIWLDVPSLLASLPTDLEQTPAAIRAPNHRRGRERRTAYRIPTTSEGRLLWEEEGLLREGGVDELGEETSSVARTAGSTCVSMKRPSPRPVLFNVQSLRMLRGRAGLSSAVSARSSDPPHPRRRVSPPSAAAANEPSSDAVDSIKWRPAMRQAYAAFRRAVYALRWTLAAARTRPKRLLLVLLLVALLVSGIVRSLQRPPLIIRASLLSAAARERRSLLASHARALFPPPPAPPLPPSTAHTSTSLSTSRLLRSDLAGGEAETDPAQSPFLSIAVALPHYSYLSDRLPSSAFEPCANLSIPIADQSWYRRLLRHHRRTRTYRCPVTRLRWPLATGGGRNDSPLIDIFLLGPSDEKPFSVAFHAKNEGDIYSAYKPLKQEWKDLFFARAAAELVRHLANEQPVGRASTAAIDVVHLHGATNAMVGYFLRAESPSPSSSVAVVYTLHDSLDEVEYSNLIANVRPFLPLAETSVAQTDAEVLQPLHPYIYRSGTQLFTSALGVDLSDVTTFVSRSIASDIVGRRFRFHLEDLVMPSIAANAARGDFIGVTNALDFSDPTKNPFRSEQLIRAGVAFSETDLTPSDGAVDDKDPPRDEPPLTSAKTRARRLLVAALPELFSVEDLHRPWFLFIGRYQYNKGCQFFETLVDLLASSPTSGRLVLLGARNNYPFDELSRLAVRFPSHVTLIDDRTPAVSHIQREWGAVLRMASDIAFVPSLSEAFGLVAAEALLFGMPVLSTGVGGLREFLDPIPDGSDDDDSPSVPRTGNSYLFDLFPDRDTAATQGAEQDYSQSAEDVRPSEALLAPARAALRAQAEIALRDWSRRQEAPFASETEDFCRRLVSQALSLRWDRPGGPVEEYTRVYDRAMQKRVA
ncbi:hypothetical protein C6P46_000086 [Rhodotorula mucilaginosa]|uniref:Starch synthase catalytic domain-containing protein n=1 Tax=Rhodotorula mucilaginosa TaxID=5537 RepID=A0A9P7B9F7_RHOMI|nr:hypothetical protein C6P46_000086 [Rhodotorula mucilaginosa]